MIDIIGHIIGWASVALLVLLFWYADDLGDGNVERIERESKS